MPVSVKNKDRIGAQNIPLDIDYDDPDATRTLVLHFKEVLRRINDLDERLREVENYVNE